MRRGIVEGDDYSVLPVPIVRFMKWLRDRLGRPKPPQEGTSDDRTAP